jgi:hypothetical protein
MLRSDVQMGAKQKARVQDSILPASKNPSIPDEHARKDEVNNSTITNLRGSNINK